mgnify:CR=1 FL=1
MYKFNKSIHQSSCTLTIDNTRIVVYNAYRTKGETRTKKRRMSHEEEQRLRLQRNDERSPAESMGAGRDRTGRTDEGHHRYLRRAEQKGLTNR